MNIKGGRSQNVTLQGNPIAVAGYHLENRLLAMGVAEEDLGAAMDYLGGELANMSEEDLEDLAEASAAMGLMDELTTEDEGETVDMGDDEFGQGEEDEPEMDIDLGDDEEEEDGE